MKRQIQAEHRREAEELGEEEAARRQWERVLADPLLGKIARERWPELSHASQNVWKSDSSEEFMGKLRLRQLGWKTAFAPGRS